MLPSALRITVSREGGASGFVDASSFSFTPEMMRIVAVAWTVAETGCPGDGGVATAATATAAATSIVDTANAFGLGW